MKARSGLALPELMIAIIVLVILAGVVHDGLRRQQEVFRSIAAMVSVRADVRDAAEVLSADLASASPRDTLPVARDSAVEFYSTLVATVSCDSAPMYTVRIPPERLERGLSLTTLLAAPDSADVLLVYRDDSASAAGEGRWDRHSIAAVATQPAGTACPPATGFTSAADAAAPAYVITLRGPASTLVRSGAPVRVLRRTRYSIYRSSDARWYLGSRRCIAPGPGSCGVIQPLSGPYAGYAAAGPGGLSLRYLDAQQGGLSWLAAGTQSARVDVSVRSPPDARQYLGRRGFPFQDSAAVSIALRNRD